MRSPAAAGPTSPPMSSASSTCSNPYMPAQLGDDELDALIGAAIDETGAVVPRDLGRVMKVLAPRVRGRADGRQVHSLVTRELARRAAGGGR